MRSPLVERARPARRVAVAGSALVVAMLAAVNVSRNLLGWNGTWLGVGSAVVVATVLLAFARSRGLTWAQLGLGRDRLGAGVRWGLSAILVVATVYGLALALPMTRGFFLDSRYDQGVPTALVSAFVIIPLGTILVEEIAFRSVLWGMLARHTTAVRVVLISSALFGLWHVLPSLHVASGNPALGGLLPGGAASVVLAVLGTVVFTAAGGLIAGELRRRSGSVLASAGMHWATNSLGVLFCLMAWGLLS